MTKAGTRVFYDESDNRILATLHRVDGGLPRIPIAQLAYLDIEYDDFNPMTHDIERVENGVPIFISTYQETPEEKRIRELEDLLLLQLEDELGGIL